MLRKIVLCIIVFLLLSSMVLARTSRFNPKVDSWYDVEEWEVEVCSQWGGTADVQKSAATPFGSETYLYSMAITLQAEKKRHYLGASNYTYVYDVGWYIQPITGSVDYKVYLIDESDNEKLIADGAANMATGDSGYYAEENTTKAFSSAKIVYGEGSGLIVPIVSYD